MLRFFGSWELGDRDGEHPGALVWKLEHRHDYTDVPPSGFGFEAGYVGLVGAPFGDQGLRATNLYWRQRFARGRVAVVAGFLDATDYVDVYALASPWTVELFYRWQLLRELAVTPSSSCWSIRRSIRTRMRSGCVASASDTPCRGT